jgi:hypothetical protein
MTFFFALGLLEDREGQVTKLVRYLGGARGRAKVRSGGAFVCQDEFSVTRTEDSMIIPEADFLEQTEMEEDQEA